MRETFARWLFREYLAELKATEGRIMKTLADLKKAEDDVGTSIANAVAVNAANMDKIKELLADGDPAAISDLVDEAQAHADAINKAFNPAGADPKPITTGTAATGT